MEQRRPNRLINATSPYLRQHAYNPVDWYPWGPEALERARREDKPIFLSIGYSTCHWCHVMAHESFEHPTIAGIMNANFICIKVDREERPDLDETYMNAVQALTGRGGWPLSVFLTPDLKPFYGGTYFPPEDRGGMPGFPRLLQALSETYYKNRDKVTEVGQKLEGYLQYLGGVAGDGEELSLGAALQAAQSLLKEFDREHGGIGAAPKFPRAQEFALMFYYFRLTGDKEASAQVSFTLEQMARGGIYDQLGGGFSRYSVDAAWVVPHFEKMLYDNALLPPLYLAQYQLTGSPLALRVARETLDFILRDMGSPQGGFYSGWDADSEGVEGKFYVWSREEVEQTVGPEAWPLVQAALGVTPEGNFEGKNILIRPLSPEELAARFSLTPEGVEQTLEAALERLRQVRSQRVPPHRDEKIIVSWNGLTISALALGAQILGDGRYREAAARAAHFLWQEMFKEDRLFRIWSQGEVSVPAFSEDYAILANALLDLYETDFDPVWLVRARRLLELLEQNFLDPRDGLYFYTAQGEEAPLVRSKSIFDQTIPSGNSMAAKVALKLFRLTEEPRWRERGLGIIRRLLKPARETPWGFSHLWAVAATHILSEVDLTLVGDPKEPGMQALLREIYRYFLPERCLVLKDPGDCAALEELVPAARTYTLPDKEPVAFLCAQFGCQPPTSAPQELGERLRQILSLRPGPPLVASIT